MAICYMACAQSRQALKGSPLRLKQVALALALLGICGGGAARSQAPSIAAVTATGIRANWFAHQAFWIDRSTVLIPSAHLEPKGTYKLITDPQARLAITESGVAGGHSVELACCGTLTPEQLSRFPQQGAGYAVLKLPADFPVAAEQEFLRGQLAVSVRRADGSLLYATGVQDAGVLDDLFAYQGKLGVVIRSSSAEPGDWSDFDDDANGSLKVKVWAPTAQSMSLRLYLKPDQPAPSQVVPMHQHGGVWVAVLDPVWIGRYYLLDEKVYAPSKRAIVENIVTDPYSIDLALNGSMSRLTDMDARANQPKGWNVDRSPALERFNDLSIYELHVRDFSIADSTVPASHRGMYLAFTDDQSDGMKHLHALAEAGLKAVHLLPTFHFNSVNEDKSTWKTAGDLSRYAPDGQEQQAAVAATLNSDAYNWGYDPVHYLAPEGAYAVDPDRRVTEYRGMVMALHHAGLRVIQDVVFNHTSGFGQVESSVLDKVVPNYYNRLDANGNLLISTCCANTASEHLMMGKLQQDAIVWNAVQYKIDGFRFDLMGFTFVKNLREIRQALDKLTIAKDGVDGAKIYLYGEGWEFGEVANSALGANGSQLNLYGQGIGTFNDRIRDGVRGGSAFDDPQLQGFATGQFTAPSKFTSQHASQSEQRTALLHGADWIRAGLAGNLRDFRFTDASGAKVSGAQVDYNGKPTGYAASPVETINYVSAHDNQCLFDAIQLKSPEGDTAAARARRQALAMSLVALGQGIPFFMAGDDLLRSKDMDADSFNSGDWFNKIDWTGRGNNWGIGLPLASVNRKQWPIEQPLLQNAALKPGAAEIESTFQAFRELLEIRQSSPLFRLATLDEIQGHLHFLNTGPAQIPGVIVMDLDAQGAHDGPWQHILVVFNATSARQTFTAPELKGVRLQLHPVQAHSADQTVRTSSADPDAGSVTVPALTAAVFVSAPF